MSQMNMVMNTKWRTSWIAACAVLFLIWTILSLDLHSYILSVVPSRVFSHANLGQSSLGDFDNDLTSPDAPLTDVFDDAKIPSLQHEPTNSSLSETTIPSSLHKQTNSSLQTNTTVSDRPLVLYAFFETELARTNLEFFIAHGLHGGADFLFVLNGETDAADIIPDEPNISYVTRDNDCYDLGAFAEVLLLDDLYKKYNRFITMNASIRGPFFPYWADGCWSDMYLGRVTDKVKLVGMTLNCQPWMPPHVQSMIWATDRIGLEILLFPSPKLIKTFISTLEEHNDESPVPAMESPGINSCPHEYWKAVAIEVYSTPLIRAAGYEVDVIMSAYHGDEKGPGGYEEKCFDTGDVLMPANYFGSDLHPFDTVFAKTNRGTGEVVLENLTQWTKARKYSSYDHCPS